MFTLLLSQFKTKRDTKQEWVGARTAIKVSYTEYEFNLSRLRYAA